VLSSVVAAALALVLGAAVGFVLTFAHRQFPVEVLGIRVPLGLVAALAIVAALLVGFRLAFGDRWIAVAAGAGVVLASAVLALPGAGGSLLVLGDAAGYLWAFGPALLALLVIVWPGRDTRRTR
jgi:hypothetical protein